MRVEIGRRARRHPIDAAAGCRPAGKIHPQYNPPCIQPAARVDQRGAHWKRCRRANSMRCFQQNRQFTEIRAPEHPRGDQEKQPDQPKRPHHAIDAPNAGCQHPGRRHPKQPGGKPRTTGIGAHHNRHHAATMAPPKRFVMPASASRREILRPAGATVIAHDGKKFRAVCSKISLNNPAHRPTINHVANHHPDSSP